MERVCSFPSFLQQHSPPPSFTPLLTNMPSFKFWLFLIFCFAGLARSAHPEYAWPFVWTLLTAKFLFWCCPLYIEEEVYKSSPKYTPYYSQQESYYSYDAYKAYDAYDAYKSYDAYDAYKAYVPPKPTPFTHPTPPENQSSTTIYNGSALHVYVQELCGYSYTYTYNENLKDVDCKSIKSRSVLANFICTNTFCPEIKQGRRGGGGGGERHKWQSGATCVQVFLSRGSQYRTSIYAQQCRRCNQYAKPDVDPEVYAERIFSTLDVLTGRPKRPKRQELYTDFVNKGPHDSARCHACQIGVCAQKGL
ncbi:MAG: hypothetical protein J3R72DRAFT_441671 [Linnemannia gamsii]|nr:MAG: hypothetical protein J3R72DRAFT_441671 [Linnemannia gamsii]